MDYSEIFPEAKQDDLCLTFGEFKPGKMPLKQAAIKTEAGFEELEGYRKRGCIFRRNGNPNSNFFTAEATGDGTIWIRNEGERSLRFQTPDGIIYPVCAGHNAAL